MIEDIFLKLVFLNNYVVKKESKYNYVKLCWYLWKTNILNAFSYNFTNWNMQSTQLLLLLLTNLTIWEGILFDNVLEESIHLKNKQNLLVCMFFTSLKK